MPGWPDQLLEVVRSHKDLGGCPEKLHSVVQEKKRYHNKRH